VVYCLRQVKNSHKYENKKNSGVFEDKPSSNGDRSGSVHRGEIEGTVLRIAPNDAAIFEVADFGIVGDLHAVIPEILAQL